MKKMTTIDPLTSTSPKLTDSTVIDANAIESSSPLDRHIPSSSPEAIHSTSPVMDPMDSPSALILDSSFSAQLPKLHSSVKKNIKTRSSKY